MQCMPVLLSALRCPVTAAGHPLAEAPGRRVIPRDPVVEMASFPPRGITAALHTSASSPHTGQQVLATGALTQL